ncbi:MAG: 5-formyltetrahydrofolate cyclo-ligase [Thermodesulfovibrionales bacterium]
MSDTGQDKAALRKEILQRRNNIPLVVRKAKNRSIQYNLETLDEVVHAGTLLLFASFRSEVDMNSMISKALFAGKRVILPKVDIGTRSLLLLEIKSPADLVPGYMGIPEPVLHPHKEGEPGSAEDGSSAERSVDINAVDAVIIPGACYDEEGNRIGYGGGYYDRLLSGLQRTIPIIAPAYEEQLVDSIPAEPHDMKVSVIVTDRRVIHCRSEMDSL